MTDVENLRGGSGRVPTLALADVEPCRPWASCAIGHMRGHGDALLIDGRWHHVTLHLLPDPPADPPPQQGG